MHQLLSFGTLIIGAAALPSTIQNGRRTEAVRLIIPSYVLAAACEGTRHDTEDATNWDWKACGKRDRHY